MKILFLSSEVVPFAKTGGLADVAGSLPIAIKELKHDIRVAMPRYKMVDIAKYKLKKIMSDLEVVVGEEKIVCDIMEAVLPGTKVVVYFIENEKYFGGRQELYMVAGKDYEDNLERFTLFSKAILAFIKKINWQPEVVHLNDWQSALVAAYIKVEHAADPFFAKTAVIYSTHNLGYMGIFPKNKLPLTGLGWDQFNSDKLEFWGNIALTKAGFVYADLINTVSEAYAKEIQTTEYGHGLDGLLRHRSADVYGIVNGLDYSIWNPETDVNIKKQYSPASFSLKVENKLELQKMNNLPVKKDVPILGMITRLADQKGFDIFSQSLEKILSLGFQFIVLGTGDPKYHELLIKEKEKHPDQIGLNLKFDALVAQMIYAGSDMFIMPSLYEPCGLGQLISFKYGTVPVVRKTGGLADTVQDFDPKTKKGNGFVFEDYNADALFDAVKRAYDVYKKKTVWNSLCKKIMGQDFSWTSSAKKYVDLYKKALAKRA